MHEALSREAWRLDLSTYASYASPARQKWIPYSWVDNLAQQIQYRLIKQKNVRLIVNAPPRHGKSELISHWLPTWYLDWWPENRIILTSYGDALASDWGKKVRDEFDTNSNTWTELRDDSKAIGDWKTTFDGGMRTCGVGGSITGKGANLIIIDDPHKDVRDAMSETSRKHVKEWYKGTLYTRLEPEGAIIVLQTRWHECDLSGYLIDESDEDWEVIRYPAIAEDTDEKDILGRKPGEVLCPERFSLDDLMHIKKIIGSYNFAGQYQQRPVPIEGGMIQRGWFQRYNMDTFRTICDTAEEWLQSWDLTFKSTGTSYVVGQVWARKDADFFLMDQKRDKLDFPDQVKAIIAMGNKWKSASTKIIEDKANGSAVISTLKDAIPGIIGWPPKGSPPMGSKEARLAAESGLIEAGNVYIPDNTIYDWGDDFIEEVVNFPHAANDDQVDAMSMALNRLKKTTNSFNFSLSSAGSKPNEWRAIYG